jgi:hypothetical protein
MTFLLEVRWEMKARAIPFSILNGMRRGGTIASVDASALFSTELFLIM